MPLPRSLLQLDFDQYQRYAAVAVLLKPLIAASRRSLRDPVRILEVGCHALNLLPEFLAPFPVEVVRADVIEGLDDGSGPFVPLRSNEPYPFDDGSFDYAVALEVLEHLPAAGRPFVMSEWARVTRGGLFFSCPNGNRVRRAEHRVDADYRERHHGAPHPWLEEHERYGRPSRREVRTLCETAGLTPIRFLNSPLAEWLPLLLATERVREQGSAAAVQKLNELLNSRPFQAFIRRPAYRSLYAAFKSERLASDANKCWGQSQNRRRTAKRVDPVRLLSRTFADLLVEQDERAADKQRLGELVHLHAAQKHRLTKLERQNTWSRWELERQKTRRPASRRPSPLADAELHSLQPQGPGRWIADGPAPHFTILGDYRRGWHRITLAGRADAGRCAKLYLDYGSGFSHQHVVHLGLWPDGLARWSTYAYFHHPVCRLRLLPADAPTLLALDEFTVRSVPAGRVALAGFLRWWKGGAVVHPAAQPESFLRLCLRLPTVPRGLTTQSPTPYEAWLAAQRPSLADRQSIRNSLDTSTQATVAVFLQIQPDSDAEALRRTVQSLLAQDVLPCEVWVAVPQDYAADWQQSPAWVELNRSVHWLPYRPETPLSRQLHDCLRQCRATLLLPLRTGHVLEPDALVQFAFHAQEHPDAGLFYADEDVWDCWNGHSRPLLKPDASPETFHFQPQLLGSAVAVRCDALRSQGFHPAYEGALLPQYFLRLLD